MFWILSVITDPVSFKKGQCSKERECVKGEGVGGGGGGSLSEHHNECALFG